MAKHEEEFPEDRYAIENVNLDTGESVRFMEIPGDRAATLVTEYINKRWEESGRNYRTEKKAI